MKILILDDDISRVDEMRANMPNVHITHCWTYQDWVNCMPSQQYDVYMLDHDLEITDPQSNGTMAASYIADNPQLVKGAIVIIHSTNHYGIDSMMRHLKHLYDLQLHIIHFAWTKLRHNIDTDTLTVTL